MSHPPHRNAGEIKLIKIVVYSLQDQFPEAALLIKTSLIHFYPEIWRDISDLQDAWGAVQIPKHPLGNVQSVYRFPGFSERLHFCTELWFALSAYQGSPHSDSVLHRAPACVAYFHFYFLCFATANRGGWLCLIFF